MIGLLGFVILTLLPGAWVSFGLPIGGGRVTGGVPFWTRLALGMVLSPLVVAVQFYALRGLGVPFDGTVIALVLSNAPALFLVLRGRRSAAPRREPAASGDPTGPGRRGTLLALALVALITGLSFGPRWTASQDRVYTGHAWMHADTAYALADGALHPEEAYLAGVPQAYPWAGSVHMAALSWLVDEPLVTLHQWINLLWLLPIAAFAMGLAGELGARGPARVAAIPWLLFGVNVLGSAARAVLPKETARSLEFLGDARYSPWVFKLFFPNAMAFAFGLFLAVAFLAVRRRAGASPTGADREWAAHLAGLACLIGIGILYPVLAPAALALVGARALAELVAPEGFGIDSPRGARGGKRLAIHGGVLAAALGVTWIHLQFVTAARVSGAMELSGSTDGVWKMATGLFVSLPLWVGMGIAWKRCGTERRGGALVLLLAGLASLGLHAVLSLPHYRNEYKFVFTLAMCWMAFPALAMQPMLERTGRWAPAMVAALTLLLASPLAAKTYLSPVWGAPPWGHGNAKAGKRRPVAATAGFELRLVETERASALCEAIRTDSPSDAILVSGGIGLHLPTLTHRPFYYPPREQALYGMNRTGEYMVRDVRGYDPALLDRRAEAVAALFHEAPAERERGLASILELGRPVVIVLDVDDRARTYGNEPPAKRAAQREADLGLLRWLEGRGRGARLYGGQGYVAWLLP